MSNYAAFGLYGYTIGSGTFNSCGNGNFGICTSSPTATLDINGTANVSSTLTSATHIYSGNLYTSFIQSATLSNTGNLSVGGTLAVNNLLGMTRKIWNNFKLGNWNITGSNYFVLAVSPNKDAENSAGGLRICGTLGGFFAANLCQIDCTITCRGGVNFLGNGFGAISEAQKWCDVIGTTAITCNINICYL